MDHQRKNSAPFFRAITRFSTSHSAVRGSRLARCRPHAHRVSFRYALIPLPEATSVANRAIPRAQCPRMTQGS